MEKVDNTVLIACFNIIAPHINIKDPFDYNLSTLNDSKYTYSFVEQFFFSSFYYKKKFKAIYDTIHNDFISSDNKVKMLNYFYKAQKLQWFFKKFYINKTYHKYKVFKNEDDLNLNKFTDFNPKYIMSIIENNTIYKFTIFDLLKLIKTNVSYSYAMFVEPRHPRNPYTNIEFSYNNLYNIYFFTKKLDITIPILLSIYFQSNFDLNLLTMNYESVIRDEIIKHYYNDSSLTKKYNDILEIVSKYKRYAPTIIIHRRYAKKEVVDKLGFLLEINLYINYSYNPSKRIFYKNLLKKKLNNFSEKNPLFGRIMVARRNIPQYNNNSIFNEINIRNSIYDYTESIPNILSPNYNINNNSINSIIDFNENNTVISNISNISNNNNQDISWNEDTDESDFEPEPIIEEPDSETDIDTLDDLQEEL